MDDSDDSVVVTRPSSIRVGADAIRRDWWIALLGGLTGGLLALGWALLQTPIYQSSATLYVTSGSDGASASDAYQGSMASQQRVSSYADLVRSDSVLAAALTSSDLNMKVSEAREALSTATSRETVLLDVTADSADPVVAAKLVNAVSAAMVDYVASLETPPNGSEPLAKLTVVTPGLPATEPSAPQTARVTSAGFVGGCLLGVLVVFGRVRFSTRIRDERDVDEVVGLSILTSVPSDLPSSNRSAVSFEAGGSIAGESYRRLRTNLAFVRVDDPVRTIVVTSPNPEEGKTITAINLAAVLAESGKTVVLVDGDLRRPTVAGRIGVNGGIGLTNILLGDAEPDEVVQSTDRRGLYVLASGPIPPNPTELLGSERARDVVEDLSSRYDYVVIDTTPVLPVSDAAVVGQYADGALVVLRSNRTRRSDAAEAVMRLQMAKISILGTVLNCVSSMQWKSSYAYYGSETRDSVVAHEGG